MRRLLVVALVAYSLLLVAPRAGACTCTSFDTRQALSEAPAAFIGTIVNRQDPPAPIEGQPAPTGSDSIYRFTVDQAVKGPLGEEVEVHSPGDAAACGISAPAEKSVALLLTEENGHWEGSLCRQPSPERLLRAAQPLPGPDGELPPELLIGSTYGVGRSVALGYDGRVAAVGRGPGQTVTLAVCPGRERVVEVFVVRNPDGSQAPGISVRRLATMAGESQFILSDRRDLPTAAACRDADGRDVVLFLADASGADPQGRIVRLVDGTPTVLWEGTDPAAAAFGPLGQVAYLNMAPEGEDLVAVDLSGPAGTGPEAGPAPVRTLARVPAGSGPMAASPDGKRLATVALAQNRASRAVMVDVEGSPARVVDVDLGGAGIMGEMVWGGNDRVVFSPRLRPAEPVRVYDKDLLLLSSWAGWAAEKSVVAGSRLFGVSQGAVRSAPLLSGPPSVIRELEDALVFAVVDAAAPNPDDGRNGSGEPTTTTTTTVPTTASTRPAPTTTTTLATSTTTTTGPAGPPSTPDTKPPRSDQAAPASDTDDKGGGGAVAILMAALAGLGLAGGGFAWRRRSSTASPSSAPPEVP